MRQRKKESYSCSLSLPPFLPVSSAVQRLSSFRITVTDRKQSRQGKQGKLQICLRRNNTVIPNVLSPNYTLPDCSLPIIAPPPLIRLPPCCPSLHPSIPPSPRTPPLARVTPRCRATDRSWRAGTGPLVSSSTE
ncbi:hypothetical protein M430DRAFT_227796 [Amorphotheca resinae ATCC 22711]|uniref:Uncharacterized protein n=1 Tax=Amorphotheca resinae ATCC 22711 TaxID=857342 RepID=A0A2T3B2U8_AMORE|nr:hypothetical protein M430DRAFT_227796 [Amorphotheca resinae ATCC 22711]PSS19974.1 hypothetical protein M430DRAFT_227796 [Amorphotheca resinae ATCC 22711]